LTQGQSIAQEWETATEKRSGQPERNKRVGGGGTGRDTSKQKRENGNLKQSSINTTTGCTKEVPLAWECLHWDYREAERERAGGGEGPPKPWEHEIGCKVTAAFFEKHASLTS